MTCVQTPPSPRARSATPRSGCPRPSPARDRGPVVALQAVLGHVGVDPGGDVMVHGPDRRRPRPRCARMIAIDSSASASVFEGAGERLRVQLMTSRADARSRSRARDGSFRFVRRRAGGAPRALTSTRCPRTFHPGAPGAGSSPSAGVAAGDPPSREAGSARRNGRAAAGDDVSSADLGRALVEDLSFTGLVVVAGVALLAPLAIGFVPGLRLPSVVLEIVLGDRRSAPPRWAGWRSTTASGCSPSSGLAFLLFLAGLEIDFERLRGRLAAPGARSASRSPSRSRVLVGARSDGGRAWSRGRFRRDRALGDLARRPRTASSRTPASRVDLRAARDRRGLDRRLRRRDPALALLLARGSTATGRSSSCSAGFRGRGAGGAPHRRASSTRAAVGDVLAACRTRRRRSASARRSCCSSGFVALADEPRPRGHPRRLHRRRDPLARRPRPAMTHPDFRRKLEAAGFGDLHPGLLRRRPASSSTSTR